MEINVNHISVPKTHRYATYGTGGPDTQYFWFCLHGSQMRCEQMIYKFSDFDPEIHYVVAPEGMNRFYLEGFGGDVVASWMTKRDRLHEISDFSAYLSALHRQELQKLSPEVKKVGLGFSQGGTTLYRWLHDQPVSMDVLIGHSCWIPEDIDLRAGATDLSTVKSIYTYGLQDAFLTEDRIEALRQVVHKNNLEVDILTYEGGHRIEKPWLTELSQRLG